VCVYFEATGIPHIDASNEADLLRAVGFIQGRNRFFQMDMLRRAARGRLSELVGERRLAHGTTVELDATMRGWSLEAGSREDARSVDPETAAMRET